MMANPKLSGKIRTVPTKVPSPIVGSGIKPIGPQEAVALAKLLSAVADPVRIRLLSIVASKGEVCSCELVGPLAKSQPTISHHTTILANAGILIGEKRGRWTWWRLSPRALLDLRRILGDAEDSVKLTT